jgi:hypothetical protein
MRWRSALASTNYLKGLSKPAVDAEHIPTTCKTQAWTRPETARFLRAQAHVLQRQNHPEAAAQKLAEAQHLDPEPTP